MTKNKEPATHGPNMRKCPICGRFAMWFNWRVKADKASEFDVEVESCALCAERNVMSTTTDRDTAINALGDELDGYDHYDLLGIIVDERKKNEERGVSNDGHTNFHLWCPHCKKGPLKRIAENNVIRGVGNNSTKVTGSCEHC